MKGRTSTRAWLIGLGANCSALALNTAQAQAPLSAVPLGPGDLPVPAQAPTQTPATRAGPPFLLQPSLTLQETYTDNATFSSAARQSDWITRGILGLDADVNTGRTSLIAHGYFAYDHYARLSALSGWSISSQGRGVYLILPDRLSFAIQGGVTDGYVSTINTSATDRSGLPNRVQLATYAAGPELTTPIGDVGDLVAAARFAQLFYSASSPSRVTGLPSNDNIVQLLASFDTGRRLSGYEALSTFEFNGDQQHYRAVDAIESLFVGIAPSLRLIGRVGYESVYQPGIVNLNAPALTAGFEYRPNDKSVLTVEGGTRFNRGIWAAKAAIQLSSRLSMNGYYTVSVQPDQVFVANSLSGLVSRVVDLPTPSFPGSYAYNANLYNRTSLISSAHVDLDYAGDTQSVSVSSDWSDRDFLSSAGGHDRTVIGSVSYTRHLRPRLDLSLQANYARTFNSPVFGASESYGGSASLRYNVTPRTDIRASYNFVNARELRTGGFNVREHAVVVSITRRF